MTNLLVLPPPNDLAPGAFARSCVLASSKSWALSTS